VNKLENELLQSEEGREFLKAYRKHILSNVSNAFKKSLDSAFDGLDEDLLSGPESLLQSDLTDVVGAIMKKLASTKEELQAISAMAEEREYRTYNAVGDELAAITSDTEAATETIMDATDGIEALVKALKSDGASSEKVSQVLRLCGEITTACSFQDITSQRVQKVVDVVKDIDSQISRIDNQLRGQTEEEVELSQTAQERAAQKENGLLHGPALPDAQTSQEEIDKLFSGG
jgi:chemotaxis protein CheZ